MDEMKMMDKLAKKLGYENWVICRSSLNKENLYTVVALNSLKEIAVKEHKQEMEENQELLNNPKFLRALANVLENKNIEKGTLKDLIDRLVKKRRSCE